MIKEDKVLIPINIRNKKYYIDKGYDIDNSCKNINVYIEHLNIHSKVKVTAICEMCGDEHIITYNKYIMNKNRNNKGYYSCFKCKNIEKEKTCLKKYGVRSYSMTEQFKLSESIKWKGIRKGNDKYLKTMLEKYGVDCYFKTKESRDSNRIWMSSNEFKEKSKITLFKKYGVERFCKTEQFKKMISDNKDLINEKIRQTFMSKYGVEN
jgi:uncharacterized protein YjaZ